MTTAELEAAISAEFKLRGATFTAGLEQVRVPDVLVTLLGSIDGHPLRFDFYGPKGVEGNSYLVLIFDLRTKNEIGNASSSVAFRKALERIDWPNVLGALTH